MSKKISQLPAFSGDLPSTALIPVSVAGTTYKAEKSQVGSGGSGTIPTLQETADVDNHLTDRDLLIRNTADSNLRADINSNYAKYYDTDTEDESKIEASQISSPKIRLFDSANTPNYGYITLTDGTYNIYDSFSTLIFSFDNSGIHTIYNADGFKLAHNIGLLTANRTRQEPDKDGTYAMTDDLDGYLSKNGDNADTNIDIGGFNFSANEVTANAGIIAIGAGASFGLRMLTDFSSVNSGGVYSNLDDSELIGIDYNGNGIGDVLYRFGSGNLIYNLTTNKLLYKGNDILAGCVENSTSASLSLSDLNTAYPTATLGFEVYCYNIGTLYKKTPSGWAEIAYNVVS